MRFDLRIHGRTAAGQACILDTSVYAHNRGQLEKEAKKAATQGPWFYRDSAEPVAETEKIKVERVEKRKTKPPQKRPKS